MSTIQPSIESPSSFADWLDEAVALVQRVNARLRPGKPPGKPAASKPGLRFGRRVLTDSRCLVLAGLADGDIAA